MLYLSSPILRLHSLLLAFAQSVRYAGLLQKVPAQARRVTHTGGLQAQDMVSSYRDMGRIVQSAMGILPEGTGTHPSGHYLVPGEQPRSRPHPPPHIQPSPMWMVPSVTGMTSPGQYTDHAHADIHTHGGSAWTAGGSSCLGGHLGGTVRGGGTAQRWSRQRDMQWGGAEYGPSHGSEMLHNTSLASRQRDIPAAGLRMEPEAVEQGRLFRAVSMYSSPGGGTVRGLVVSPAVPNPEDIFQD